MNGQRKVTEGEKSKEKVWLASCDVFLNFVILKVVNVVWGFFSAACRGNIHGCNCLL